MKTQHTPAPWRVATSDELSAITSSHAVVRDLPKGEVLVICCVWKTSDKIAWARDDAEGKANAHLIAAAPELFQMVEKLIEVLDCPLDGEGGGYSGFREKKQAKALIAKVKGGAS